MKTETELSAMSGADLTSYYNGLAGTRVSRFASKPVAIKKILAAQASLGSGKKVVAEKPVAEKPVAEKPVPTPAAAKKTRAQIVVDALRENAMTMPELQSLLDTSKGCTSDTLCLVRKGEKCQLKPNEVFRRFRCDVDKVNKYIVEVR